jgi:phosphoglycerol transferase MdoB-like AlkP superfamily enzyme
LTILALKTTQLKIETIAVIFAPILFYTISIDRKKDFNINKIEVFVFILAYALMFVIDNYNIILLITHTLITIRAIFKIIIELHHHQKINILHLVLAFYMISSVASLIIFLNGDHQGIVLFYINLAFQTLIAIFFASFREDHPKLIYNVTPVFKD